MKLQTFDCQSFMANAHDFAILRPCSDFQAIRKAFTLNNKGMIACRRKRIWQISKHANAIVENRRSFAMHELLGVNDFAAKSLTYALMAQTHAQYGNLTL